MADTEYTAKFNIDITDLKKGMQQANQLMRVANSEFKAATGGMDRWSESADGLSAKIKQLNAVQDAQKAKLKVLQAQYAQVVEAEGESSKGAQELYIKMNNLQGEIGKTEVQIAHYSSKLDEMQRAEEEAAKAAMEEENALESLKTIIGGQEAELAKLKTQYAQVALEQGESSEEARTLAKEISSLSGDLAENKSKLNEAESAADKFDATLDDVGDSAEDSSGGFTIMKDTLADLISDGIKAAADAFKDLVTQASEANASFQAQTGASAAEMDKFSDSIEKVYSQNFGESMQDVADAMAQVKQQTGEIDPSKLEDMTKNAITLRDTFGFEVNESIRAVNMLMKQFGISSDEAFNIVVKGAQNGLDKNGDLLDTLNEYSVHYSQLGYDADEFYNSLLNGADAGTFSVDKLGDSVKEFGIITKEMSEGSKEGFELIGLSAGDMRKEFAKGGESAQNATVKTLKALLSMDDQVKQNQAGVDLFGTMWEDLGIEGVKALMDVSGEAVTTTDAIQELNNVKYSDIGSQIGTIGRLFQSQIFQPIIDLIMPAVQELAQFIIDHFDVIGPIITGVAAAFGVLAAALGIQTLINGVQKAFALLNLTLLANPIVLIVAAIAGLVAAFIALWNTSESFREFWINLWDTVSSAFMTVWDAIVNFFTVTIPNAFNSAVTAVSGFVTGVVEWFQQLPTRISEFINSVITTITEWASNMVGKAVEVGSNFLTNIVTFFQQLPYNIGLFLGTVLGTVASWVVNMVNKAIETGTNFLTNIVTFFQQLPGKIAAFLSNVISNVTKWASNMKSKAVEAGRNFINNVINFIKNLPSKIASFLSNVISNVTKWASNMKSKATEAGKNFLNNVVNGIKNLPSKIATTLSNVITKLKTWVSDMGSKGREGAKKLFDNVVNGIKGLPERIKSIGSDIVHGLWNGISGAGSWIKNKITGFASGLVSGFKKAFKIKSPSRVMRDEVGKQITAGIGVGIASGEKSAITTVKKVALSIFDAAKNNLKGYKFKEAGTSAIESINSGIESKTKASITSIKNLVNKQINAYNKQIDKKIKKTKSKSEKSRLAQAKKDYSNAGKAAITAYTDAINNYASKTKSTINSLVSDISESFQNQYDALVKAQESMLKKMSEYGELYKTDSSNNVVLTDLKAQTDILKEYAKNLSAVKVKINGELFEEITSMGVDEGNAYMKKLLSLSEQEIEDYNNAYVEKMNVAKSLSKGVYKKDISSLKKQYNTAIDEVLGGAKSKLETIGKQAMQGFISGMGSQTKNMNKQVTSLANSIVKQFKKALKIKSPSRVFAEIGGYSAEGYLLGFKNSMASLSSDLSNSLQLNDLKKSARSINGQVSGGVVQNFYQYNNSPKALSRLEIYRQTKNQLAFAKGG